MIFLYVALAVVAVCVVAVVLMVRSFDRYVNNPLPASADMAERAAHSRLVDVACGSDPYSY